MNVKEWKPLATTEDNVWMVSTTSHAIVTKDLQESSASLTLMTVLELTAAEMENVWMVLSLLPVNVRLATAEHFVLSLKVIKIILYSLTIKELIGSVCIAVVYIAFIIHLDTEVHG